MILARPGLWSHHSTDIDLLVLSDLLESGVDSEYEEMAAGSRWPNNNNNSPPGGPCSQCVTVINVCPSPGHTLQPGRNLQPGHNLQPSLHHTRRPSQTADSSEPPYENLSFHKVTINVPDAGEEPGGQGGQGGSGDPNNLYSDKPRVLLRKPPLRKSKVPLKYQGIKRVKSKSKTQKHDHVSAGYSQKEVWNWLYLEEAAKSNGLNVENYESYDGEFSPDDIARMAREKSVSVQFSPVEFLQATNRLAHLNLEGFERFVGNTIDRALAGARAKSSDVLDAGSESGSQDKDKETPHLDQSLIDCTSGRDTDMYVVKDSQPDCGHSKVRPSKVCESCLRSGDSSCSSALSSLESVKSSLSQGRGSRESDSSARGSLGSHLSHLSSEANQPGSQHYMRMSGQKIYRGNIRASLPVGGPSHKPYQTLEVSPEQGKLVHISPLHTISHPHFPPDKAGLVTLVPTHPPLQLVDPAIQLHQQE